MAEGQAAAPAATTAPVTAPATASTTTIMQTTPPAATSSLTEGLNDIQKGFMGTKGYKGLSDVVDSYMALEKHIGAPNERIIKFPERFYDDSGKFTPEGRAVYERLGAPKDVKEYGIEVPKEGGDPKRLEVFLKAAHELGLTKTQAQKLAAADTEYYKQSMTTMKETQALKIKEGDDALRKEWGQAFDQNMNIAKAGATKMGMTQDQVNALTISMGTLGAMNFLKGLGQATGEATFVTGSQQSQAMEPAVAQFRIKELINDSAWYKRFMAGGAEEKAEWARLHKFANG
jgi:hypothetical protein